MCIFQFYLKSGHKFIKGYYEIFLMFAPEDTTWIYSQVQFGKFVCIVEKKVNAINRNYAFSDINQCASLCCGGDYNGNCKFRSIRMRFLVQYTGYYWLANKTSRLYYFRKVFVIFVDWILSHENSKRILLFEYFVLKKERKKYTLPVYNS